MPVVRRLTPSDLAAARALLTSAYGTTPYAPRWLEVLERAASRPDLEHRGVVISRGPAIEGLTLFGDVAGAIGVTRAYVTVLAARNEVANDAMFRYLREEVIGCRLLVAELADDPALAPAAELLADAGFHEEARIPSFFRDGVALRFLRLDLDPATG